MGVGGWGVGRAGRRVDWQAAALPSKGWSWIPGERAAGLPGAERKGAARLRHSQAASCLPALQLPPAAPCQRTAGPALPGMPPSGSPRLRQPAPPSPAAWRSLLPSISKHRACGERRRPQHAQAAAGTGVGTLAVRRTPEALRPTPHGRARRSPRACQAPSGAAQGLPLSWCCHHCLHCCCLAPHAQASRTGGSAAVAATAAAPPPPPVPLPAAGRAMAAWMAASSSCELTRLRQARLGGQQWLLESWWQA